MHLLYCVSTSLAWQGAIVKLSLGVRSGAIKWGFSGSATLPALRWLWSCTIMRHSLGVARI